jgi:hypothetical protein
MVWEFLFLGFMSLTSLQNLEPLQPAEMEVGFDQRILIAVAAVHGVALDALSKAFADSSFSSVSRVGGANQLAEVFNSIILFENSRYDRAFSHKGDELAKEAALLVNGVEFFCLFFRETGKLHSLYLIACADDDVDYLSGMTVSNCIGLNHSKCYSSSHVEG